MTKNGSNDRKRKARKLARAEGIPLTEAHARLQAAKMRPVPTPAPELAQSSTGDVHQFMIRRTLATGEHEFLDDTTDTTADQALWYGSDRTLTAACSCGWTNPNAGPRFPDLPRRDGREPNEQTHWRWYHLVAWAQHDGEADGAPTMIEEFQDPAITLNNLTIGVIFVLRLLLNHAQDDPDRVADVYETVHKACRAIRVQTGRANKDESEMPDDALPDDLGLGLRTLLGWSEHGISGRPRGYWERLAVEMAAGELLQLVRLDPRAADTVR